MTLTTRDALLAIRQFHQEDEESAAIIADLQNQLSDALDVRAQRLHDVYSMLEAYVDYQSTAHGFNSTLEDLVAKTTKKSEPVKRTAKKRTKKKVSKKRKTTKKVARRRPSGWQGELDETITLSNREAQVVRLFRKQWPKFVTPDDLVAKGIVPDRTHASPKITQLRKKGVPIESAKQARRKDDTIDGDVTGYRLIG